MTNKKIDTLTSLRFFAAYAVVVGHSIELFGLSKTALRHIPAYNGVTFFFVLSGFILTYNYRRLPTREAIWRFASARFARLWPLHVATFLLTILVLPEVRATLLTSLGLLEAAANLLFLQAFVPILAFQFSYNDISWSISAEFYFYACFVGLIALIDRPFSRLFWVALAGPIIMIALSIMIKLPTYIPDPFVVSLATTIYIHPVTRLADFGCGMIAAGFFLRPNVQGLNFAPRLATVLEIVMVALIVATAGLTYGLYAKIWPSAPPAVLLWLERSGASPLYALAIFVLAFERGYISRWLRHPALVLFGEISFATYLVHHIVLRWLMANPWSYADLPLSLAFLLYLAANIPASWLLWRFIETPARTGLYRRLTMRVGRPVEIAPSGTF